MPVGENEPVVVVPTTDMYSKTLITNILFAALGLLNFLPQWLMQDGHPVVPTEWLAPIATLVVPLVNVVLRYLSTGPLASMAKTMPKA